MRALLATTNVPDIDVRIQTYDWTRVASDLDEQGPAILPSLLSAAESETIARFHDDEHRFRSHIVMQNHGFGRGEYKYFAHPLPDIVACLRTTLYPRLTPIADRWNESLGVDTRYPPTHAQFLERCHRAGQTRPTPLLLRYGPGDYNRLHQDLYGAHVFPLQVTILLSEPAVDFTGGEFVLTETRPRMQSRAEVVPLRRGDGVVFAVRERPVQGTKGFSRAALRHGVSRVRSGTRQTLGILFHDAR